MNEKPRLLILGGTSEAVVLARDPVISEKFHSILSLAGLTQTPNIEGLSTRIGGFGGDKGFRQFLIEEQIRMVLDVTHPFAAHIAHRTHRICQELSIPHAKLVRSPWLSSSEDRWIEVVNEEQALLALPQSSDVRCFLTLGRFGNEFFASRADVYFLRRSIEAERVNLFKQGANIVARPPFSLEDELTLLRRHQINILVSRNAGGPNRPAKLEAARQLKLSIIMIKQPSPPEGLLFSNVESLRNWAI